MADHSRSHDCCSRSGGRVGRQHTRDLTKVDHRLIFHSEIAGVVPDFSIGSVCDAIEPAAYYIDPQSILSSDW